MLFIDLHYHASNFLIRDAEGAQEDGYRGGVGGERREMWQMEKRLTAEL